MRFKNESKIRKQKNKKCLGLQAEQMFDRTLLEAEYCREAAQSPTQPTGRKRRPMGPTGSGTCVVMGCLLVEWWENGYFPVFSNPAGGLWCSICAAPLSHPQVSTGQP